MSVKESLQKVLAGIPANCALVAVSKTHPAELILETFNLGQKDFGENRVPEMVQKAEVLPKEIRWHLVGHLQTNKVKQIAPFVHLIHSVDSEKLLAEINKQAEKNRRVINCLIQIHVALEENKTGFNPEEAKTFFESEKWRSYPHTSIRGLMCMATFTEDETIVRDEFRRVKKLFDGIKTLMPSEFNILSMGMSGDHKIALAEGSTMVRIGTAIFGVR